MELDAMISEICRKVQERVAELEKEEVSLQAVPYCMWNNRGQGEMLVWHKLRI